ncbi:MAG: type II toxin-antitoxin system VapB family antitoxin [Gemmatimonadaceae bacterium]|nr:type II toxin-antitoxin system VapB family antitoxin [Gemmatimonadaceae bacterium]
MKTTIDIADALLDQAKAIAAREGVTVRSLVEEGLREVLARRRAKQKRFQLRDASFSGQGLQPGVDLSDWSRVSAEIYGGRGG